MIKAACDADSIGKACKRVESGQGIPQQRPRSAYQDDQVWGVHRASLCSQLHSGHSLHSAAGSQSRSSYTCNCNHSFCLHIWEYLLSWNTLLVQTLVNEVNGYGEKKTTVENLGCRLTELSRKEDCDIIHNLIMAVQDRYSKLQQCTLERGRTLEEVKKSAKQVEWPSPSISNMPFSCDSCHKGVNNICL